MLKTQIFKIKLRKNFSVVIQMLNFSSLVFLNCLIAAFASHIRVMSERIIITFAQMEGEYFFSF
jgi:hypothetical protein